MQNEFNELNELNGKVMFLVVFGAHFGSIFTPFRSTFCTKKWPPSGDHFERKQGNQMVSAHFRRSGGHNSGSVLGAPLEPLWDLPFQELINNNIH